MLENVRIKIIVLQIFILIITSCNLIDYSPYDVETPCEHLHEHNLSALKSVLSSDTLFFVALADIHNDLDDLNKAVAQINSMPGVNFVLICGDITNAGLNQEYKSYYHVIKKLKVPYITVIGNHDYRSNGGLIYKKMFGPVNFSFKSGAYKFVVFDNVVWENNNASPDFKWMDEVLDDPSFKLVVFAHIPIESDQLSSVVGEQMKSILSKRKVVLTVHGHCHDYSFYKKDEINFLTAGSVNRRVLNLISLYDTSVFVQRLNF